MLECICCPIWPSIILSEWVALMSRGATAPIPWAACDDLARRCRHGWCGTRPTSHRDGHGSGATPLGARPLAFRALPQARRQPWCGVGLEAGHRPRSRTRQPENLRPSPRYPCQLSVTIIQKHLVGVTDGVTFMSAPCSRCSSKRAARHSHTTQANPAAALGRRCGRPQSACRSRQRTSPRWTRRAAPRVARLSAAPAGWRRTRRN